MKRLSTTNSHVTRKFRKRNAILLLILATISVIAGSTVAWFTLSTAPEVSGIYTAIGANGNLEIALFTGADGSQIPESAVSDSGKNDTWGNIVDLSDVQAYGLNQIVLKPAALNILENGQLNFASPLKIPSYSTDGRLSFLIDTSTTAKYDTVDQSFSKQGNGVRAIGVANGITPQESDYKAAIAMMSAKRNEMKTAINQSIENGAGQLASAIVEHKLFELDTNSSGAYSYDISGLTAMITSLEQANAALEAYLKAYFEANFAIVAKGLDATTYDAIEVWSGGRTLSAAMANGFTLQNCMVPAPATDSMASQAYEIHTKVASVLEQVRTQLARDGVLTSAEWTAVEAYLDISGFFPEDGLTLNGLEITPELKRNNTLALEIEKDGDMLAEYVGGVYSELAKVCGNGSGEIELAQIEYNNNSITEFPVKMIVTESAAETIDVSDMLPADPTFGIVSNISLAELYGYAIDLAFRTNVETSHLLLETTPVDRIYSGNSSSASMGRGSNMTFTGRDGMTQVQMITLMQSIRIVFADEMGTILGVGVLDEFEANDTTVTGDIRLANFTVANHTLTLKTTASGYEFADPAELMALEQNEMQRMSVYVYLDGESVKNASVINAGIAMAGSINLQFGSDVELIPMEVGTVS